jgi:hypothetical protein
MSPLLALQRRFALAAFVLVFLVAAGAPVPKINAPATRGGEVYLDIRERPPRPVNEIPFPPIRDWNSLRITLKRGACFGPCPVYQVQISGDGAVAYRGGQFVASKGKRRSRIASAAVHALFDAFRDAKFYWLFNDYTSSVTDAAGYEVTISFDGQTKTVTDYVGTEVGMPRIVRDLERRVDDVAGTEKWVKGRHRR